jgi:hypothetical protein
MIIPAAIDMLPSPAERAGMREGTWLRDLREDVTARHVFTLKLFTPRASCSD